MAAADSVLSGEDQRFLARQARLSVDKARLLPGQVSGKWKNATSFAVCVPGGNLGYPAFWIRDAVMMLGGGLVPAKEVEGWIRLIALTVKDRDWNVRSGVVVPAWAIPDHINFDGKPVYYPGTLASDATQGGGNFGKYPPLDDHFYFVTAVWEHWRETHDLGLFRSRLKTSFGEAPLSELCERAHRVAPADPDTGLVTAGDPDTENAKDFGFCDTVFKSGKLLFPSLLKIQSAGQLAEMFAVLGDRRKSNEYSQEAARIRLAIGPTFFRASDRSGEGWLHSATGLGNQPDVWGSAYAIATGALNPPVADRVARALVRAYREKTAVREGCVRHVPSDDRTNGGAWQRCLAKPGEYQNGGYWGTATGWYIAALYRVDRRAAADLASDYIGFLRRGLRADGMAAAWEWFNPDTGKRANDLYVATVALPYISLMRAGLLSPR